jgi:hypothetical protein
MDTLAFTNNHRDWSFIPFMDNRTPLQEWSADLLIIGISSSSTLLPVAKFSSISRAAE